MREGFKCVSAKDNATLDAFQGSFDRVGRALGTPLSRPQQSWVCVIQSLPLKHIPRALRLNGPVYPQDNIAQECLWQYRAVSERAKQILDTPVQTEESERNAS
jgi:hypothetical protein